MKINFNDQFSLGNSDLVHREGRENTRVRYLKLFETLNFKKSLKEKKTKNTKIIFINENAKHVTIS